MIQENCYLCQEVLHKAWGQLNERGLVWWWCCSPLPAMEMLGENRLQLMQGVNIPLTSCYGEEYKQVFIRPGQQ